MLDRFARVARRLVERYTGSPLLKELSELFDRPEPAACDGDLVLVEAVEDPFYMSIFGGVVTALRARSPLRAEYIIVRSLRPNSTGGAIKWVKALLYSSRLTDRPWRRAFDRFCDGLAYRSASPLAAGDERQLRRTAERLIAECRNDDDLNSLTVDDIQIGDLVIDTYLRFKPTAKIDRDDPFMSTVLEQALRDLRHARTYFAARRPKIYLTSYTTYVQHGIPARVAAHLGTRVVSFGNLQELCKINHPADMTHTRRAFDYAARFAALDQREAAIQAAEAALSHRMAGGTDAATAYMGKSAYAGRGEVPTGMAGATVVFLHDFYDSPHIYRWMIFHDFWSWICFTIDRLQAAGVPFFVKSHPNQVAANVGDIEELRRRYPDLRFVPVDVTNRQLVEAGMACAVTVYGTVASEMAFMGVPSIACGDHPHISFDFCSTARDRDDYARLLEQAPTLRVDPASAREQACQFYFMHNLDGTPTQLAARDAIVSLRMRTSRAEAGDDAGGLRADYAKLFAMPAFNEMIDLLAQSANAGAGGVKRTAELQDA